MICWTLGHHRAPQRGRQRPRPDLARPAHGARRAIRQRHQPAPRPEQRPGRRRHGRPARTGWSGFQHVENDEPRERCDNLWGVRVPPKRGWHLSGMFEAMERGELTALYVIGENPLQSEADRHHDREAAARPRPARRAGHLPDRDRRDRRHRPAGRRGLGRERGDRHQQRAARPAGARALVPPGEAKDDLWIIFEIAKRMGADWGEADAEAVWNEVRELSPVHRGHDLRAARGVGRPPVAVLRRVAPGRAVPALAAVGGPGAGQPGAVRAGRARPAGRPPRRRLPDPPHDRAPPGLVQHGRPVGRLSVPAASRRDARPGARGSRALRAGRGRAGAGGVAARLRRGAGAGRRGAAARPRVHDAPLPGRRHDQQPDDRRDGPQVRHGRVQGDGDPDREAGRAAPAGGARARWPRQRARSAGPRSSHRPTRGPGQRRRRSHAGRVSGRHPVPGTRRVPPGRPAATAVPIVPRGRGRACVHGDARLATWSTMHAWRRAARRVGTKRGRGARDARRAR